MAARCLLCKTVSAKFNELLVISVILSKVPGETSVQATKMINLRQKKNNQTFENQIVEIESCV